MENKKICRFCNKEKNHSHHCSGKDAFNFGQQENIKSIEEIIKLYFEKKSIELQKLLNQKQVNKFEKENGCINYLKISLDEVEKDLLNLTGGKHGI